MALTSGLANPSNLHGSVTLKDFVIEGLQDAENYVGSKLFPHFGYKQRSADYFVWSLKTANRRNMAVRTALAESAGMVTMREIDTYTVPVKAVHLDLPKQEVDDEHDALDMEQSAGVELADQVMLEREHDLAELLLGAWATSATGGTVDAVGAGAKQVQTLTFDSDVVASNSIAGEVDSVAITPVVFSTDVATTLGLLATEIAGKTGIESAIVTGNIITVTTLLGSADKDLTAFVVTLGASQPVIYIAETAEGSAPASADFTQWDDVVNSQPIRDVKGWCRTIQRQTGKRFNTGVLARDVYDELTMHPDVIDRLHTGGTSGVTTASDAEFAKLFGLKDLYVMDAIVNVGTKTDPDPSNWIATGNFVFERSAWFGYVAPSRGRWVRTSAMLFTWDRYKEFSEGGLSATIEPINLVKADRYEVETAHVYKIVDASLGIKVLNTISDIYA